MADTILIEAGDEPDIIQVIKHDTNLYSVARAGVIRHPNSSVEDAMRALAFYLHSALYSLSQNKNSNN